MLKPSVFATVDHRSSRSQVLRHHRPHCQLFAYAPTHFLEAFQVRQHCTHNSTDDTLHYISAVLFAYAGQYIISAWSHQGLGSLRRAKCSWRITCSQSTNGTSVPSSTIQRTLKVDKSLLRILLEDDKFA